MSDKRKIKFGTPYGVVIRIDFDERSFMPKYACFMASGKGVTQLFQKSIDIGYLVSLMYLYQIDLKKVQSMFEENHKQNHIPTVLVYSDGLEDVIVEYAYSNT